MVGEGVGGLAVCVNSDVCVINDVFVISDVFVKNVTKNVLCAKSAVLHQKCV